MENLENTTAGTETQEQSTENKNGKFYSDDELSALLQKEGDRRITQFQKTLEKRNRESEKLKNMSDTERYEYSLEQRERALEEKEQQLALAEMTNTASKILAEKGLSLDLVKFVVNSDADVTNENIKALDKAFKQSVKAEVEKRLSSNTPKVGLPREDVMTKEAFRKLPLRDQQELYRTNRDLYEQFTK